MNETDFKEYSLHFKGSNFRNPCALAVAPLPIRRLLIIGSCFASSIQERCCHPNDFVLFNGGVMPPLPHSPSAYDFQLVQIPLRILLRDDDLWHLAYDQVEAFEQALATAIERLKTFFRQFLQHHEAAGLPALERFPFTLHTDNDHETNRGCHFE